MKMIPLTERVALVRTGFSNLERWQDMVRVVATPTDPFFFHLEIIDDREFSGFSTDAICSSVPEAYPHSIIFIADDHSIAADGYPCLAVDLSDRSKRSFRALAHEIASIENNLSIANMVFEEFADAAEADGVFRGFR